MIPNFNNKDFREEHLNGIKIIKSIGANLNGDEKENIVYLMGKKLEESSIYYENLYIVVSNGETGEDTTFEIENGSGYNPKIYINDFNGDGLDEILFISEEGGISGYINANIYCYKNKRLKEIFNIENINRENIYTVSYKNSYIVEISDEMECKEYVIDISLKSKDYLSEIYNEKGIIKKDMKGEVLFIGGMYIVDIDNDNISELVAIQRVIGAYNSDTLGYINSVLKFDREDFKIIRKFISIEGISQECRRCCDNMKTELLKTKYSIDFSKVNFIEAEKTKDYKIERALEKEFNIRSGIDNVSYLYNRVDLNDNKKKYIIAYIEGPKFCIENGCTVVILEDRGKSYSVISKISGAINPIIVSDEKTNGFKNIIMKVDNRNGEYIYKELKFNGNAYPLNPIDEPKVKKGSKIQGIAFIADDLFYVKGIEF